MFGWSENDYCCNWCLLKAKLVTLVQSIAGKFRRKRPLTPEAQARIDALAKLIQETLDDCPPYYLSRSDFDPALHEFLFPGLLKRKRCGIWQWLFAEGD